MKGLHEIIRNICTDDMAILCSRSADKPIIIAEVPCVYLKIKYR